MHLNTYISLGYMFIGINAESTHPETLQDRGKYFYRTYYMLSSLQLSLSVFIVYFVYCCLVTESCLTLQPMDCSLSGSSVHGISQARVLEWIAISFYRVSSQPKDRSHGPKIHLTSPALQADSLPLSRQGSPYLLYISLKSLNFCLKNFVTCPEHHFNNNPDEFLKNEFYPLHQLLLFLFVF